MLFLSDFLEICKNGSETKNICLNITTKNGEHFLSKMESGHYIVDDVWYSEVKKVDEVDYPMTNDSFIDEMEQESDEEEWGDRYVAPMDDLGNCELVFVDNVIKVYDKDNVRYEIIKVVNGTDITIYLKEI